MLEYYIHQIGSISNEKTYERLINILKTKCLASREYLEKIGVEVEQDNTSFELEIPKGKEWMYYSEDIHKDRVSLSDPRHRVIKKVIEMRNPIRYTCFDYNYIGFAVSREVPILPKEDCHGLALGEVQVKDKIDSEYIMGLLVPISTIEMEDEKNSKIVDMLFQICVNNDFPLDIYNYDGELLRSRDKNKKL